LVLLPLAVALAEPPFLPVEGRARQVVSALPTVALHQDAAAVRLVVDVGQ